MSSTNSDSFQVKLAAFETLHSWLEAARNGQESYPEINPSIGFGDSHHLIDCAIVARSEHGRLKLFYGSTKTPSERELRTDRDGKEAIKVVNEGQIIFTVDGHLGQIRRGSKKVMTNIG